MTACWVFLGFLYVLGAFATAFWAFESSVPLQREIEKLYILGVAFIWPGTVLFVLIAVAYEALRDYIALRRKK